MSKSVLLNYLSGLALLSLTILFVSCLALLGGEDVTMRSAALQSIATLSGSLVAVAAAVAAWKIAQRQRDDAVDAQRHIEAAGALAALHYSQIAGAAAEAVRVGRAAALIVPDDLIRDTAAVKAPGNIFYAYLHARFAVAGYQRFAGETRDPDLLDDVITALLALDYALDARNTAEIATA